MAQLFLQQMPSLEKVFCERLNPVHGYNAASLLKGEEFCYQVAFWVDERLPVQVRLDCDPALAVCLFEVGNAPSERPVFPHAVDDNYLSAEPGLYPDILYPLQSGATIIAQQYYKCVWVSVKTTEQTLPGDYAVGLTFENVAAGLRATAVFHLQVKEAVLPPQELIFTQWFHSDCLASYYGFPVFSEAYWDMVEKFVKMATAHGMNMILTPIFTPPLDTDIGAQRPTVQLVGIKKEGEVYSFDFAKLKKWITLCEKCGIIYFEMAHLFTQWGAECTPKIVATQNGEETNLFGWHVRADSAEYRQFTAQFLPALTAFLREEGIADKTVFHISDEPHGEAHIRQYQVAKDVVSEHLHGFKIMDALSDFALYERGTVSSPIPASDAIQPFLDGNVPDLWTYYCCGQSVGVSNRFFAMPSARTRIMGLQLYKFNITGFLQWGYNFYYSQQSRRLINPFLTTDGEGAWPSGDAFSVYPGPDGPIASLRLKVFFEALQDLRALLLLEKKIGRAAVLALIEEGLDKPLTFDCYPRDWRYIADLRERVNQLA